MDTTRPKLELVVGMPGCGKSQRCIDAFLARPENTAIVVPGSAEADALVKRIPTDSPAQIHLGSIFTWEGFCRTLTEAGPAGWCPTAKRDLRVGLIARAAQREISEGDYFGKVSALSGFHRKFADFHDELAAAGFTPETLEQAAGEVEDRAADRLFQTRITEICRIGSVFRTSLERLRNQAPAHCHIGAVEAIGSGASLQWDAVWFDGFRAPTEGQFATIEALIERAVRVHLTLTWSTGREELFRGADWARAAALKRFVVNETDLGQANLRARSDSLRLLSTHLFGDPPTADATAYDTVTIFDAPSVYAEVEQVARQCRRLTASGEFRFGEIALLIRDWNTYTIVIENLFGRFEVPYVWEREEPLERSPVIRAVSQAARLALGDWQRSEVEVALASSFSAVPRGQMLGICRSAARTRVVEGYEVWRRFLGGSENAARFPEAVAFLTKLASWRETALRQPVSMEAFSKLLTDFIESVGYDVSAVAPAAPNSIAESCALTAAFAVIDTMKHLERAEPTQPDSAAKHFAAVCAAWSEATYRTVQPRGDAVRVLDAGRPGGSAPRVAFVMGISEGAFPRRINEEPFLRDDERRLLSEVSGLRLVNSKDRAAEERELFYLAVTLPTERLYLSYPRADDNSDSIPALYLQEVREALPDNCLATQEFTLAEVAPSLEDAVTERDRLLSLAASYGRSGAAPEVDDATQMRFAAWCALPPAPTLVSEEAKSAAKWAGRPVSVTELETMGRCPFQHLARYTMGLHAPRTAVTRADQGRVVHGALHRYFVSLSPGEQDDAETMAQRLRAEIDAVLESGLPDAANWESQLLRFFADELLSGLARREQQYREKHGLTPAMFELGFGMHEIPADPDIPIEVRPHLDPRSSSAPLNVALLTGENLRVCGTIDRVDLSEDERFGLAIDYKLRGAEDIEDASLKGGLQMPMYVIALKSLFGYEWVAPAYDSLIGERRHRLISTDLPEPYKAVIIPIEGETAIKQKGPTPVQNFLDDALGRVRAIAAEMKAAVVNPRPEQERCSRCAYADLCRTNLLNHHDGAQTDAGPFGI